MIEPKIISKKVIAIADDPNKLSEVTRAIITAEIKAIRKAKTPVKLRKLERDFKKRWLLSKKQVAATIGYDPYKCAAFRIVFKQTAPNLYLFYLNQLR